MRQSATLSSVQEHAGVDVITDGEWRRKSYIGVIAELAHGFELSLNPQDGRPWTVVVDKLAPKRPGFIAQEISFLKTITSRQIKATLPAPALLGERMWHPEKSAKAYPKREDFVRDCVPILKRELELIQKAGADIIQIDDPHLCLFVDSGTRKQFPNPDAAADFSVDMVNAIVEGSRNTRLAVHLCRRAGARGRGEAQFQGGYEPIINQLNRLRVHHLTMEFTAPGVRRFDRSSGSCARISRSASAASVSRPARSIRRTRSLPGCGRRLRSLPRNGSSSTPIADLRRAPARQSALTRRTASSAMKWRRRKCCATNSRKIQLSIAPTQPEAAAVRNRH